MYISMTGYGSASVERNWGVATLEISSVNHRYQEIFTRLPRELASLDAWLNQKIRSKFRRGKVNVRVEISWAAEASAAAINFDVLRFYWNELSREKADLTGAAPLPFESVLLLPGVFASSSKNAFGDDDPEELLTDLLDRAAASWNEMRAIEGDHLKAAVEEHISTLEKIASDITGLWRGAYENALSSMRARLAAALEGVGAGSISEERFAQEAVIIADKWDIAEELARLSSHVKKFREIGGEDEPVGRKLDFLVQEMNREVNTINSKSADTGVRWASVEAKAAIERAREQIQNLE